MNFDEGMTILGIFCIGASIGLVLAAWKLRKRN